MNPFTYGRFALMLVSDKLSRWVPFLCPKSALLKSRTYELPDVL